MSPKTENVLLKTFHFNFSTLVQLVHKWVHCLPIISDYFVLVLKRLFLRHYLLIKQKRLIVNTLTQTSVTRGQSVSTCQLFETSVHCIIVQSFCFVLPSTKTHSNVIFKTDTFESLIHTLKWFIWPFSTD